jgi:hypothetical protein
VIIRPTHPICGASHTTQDASPWYTAKPEKIFKRQRTKNHQSMIETMGRFKIAPLVFLDAICSADAERHQQNGGDYPGQDKAHRVSAGCGMLREIAL